MKRLGLRRIGRRPVPWGGRRICPRLVTVGWFHHKKSGKRVRVYNTHWSHVSEEARMASAELIASIDAIHGVEATAVLGDFNEEAEGGGRQPW